MEKIYGENKICGQKIVINIATFGPKYPHFTEPVFIKIVECR